MEPRVIYEDEFVLGLDKPSGLLVHGDGKSTNKTLVDWINENYPALAEVGEPFNFVQGRERKEIKRPGIVHRLDRDTSGVILVAKTQEAHQFLKQEFQNRKVEKIYHAVVWENFSEDKLEGIIGKPIGRSASDFRKWSSEYGAKGELREAVTEYKVLAQTKTEKIERTDKTEKDTYTDKQRSLDIGVGEKFAYLEVRPKTGRTHQIRVHLKSISHPIVCDKLYSNKICSPESCLGFSRLALHALSIKLELPNGTFVKIESSMPEEFENLLVKLKSKLK